jgi:3-oxoacyl-[acyl-carrier protein] reductase
MPYSIFSIDGKVAIVTGAGSGIGHGIARILAKNGAKVIVADLNERRAEGTVEQIRAAGGIALASVGDVSSSADMEQMAQFALDRFGKIDILCENAGIYPFSRIEKMDEKQWETVLNVNLKGCFLGLKSCLPQMLRQEHGRVIMISSITGFRTGVIGQSHYSASKAGIVGFMRSAALELGRNNITVNAIEPGAVATEGTSIGHGEILKEQEKITPTGRLTTPEDIGNVVLFLSSEAARNITGTTIVIDGGRSIVE